MGSDSDRLSGTEKFNPQGWNDPAWAVIFIVQLLGVFAWVGYAASTGRFQAAASSGSGQMAAFHAAGTDHEVVSGDVGPGTAMVLLFSSLGLATIWAGVWLSLLSTFPEQMVWGSICSCVALFVVLGVVLTVMGSIFGGLVMILLALALAVGIYMWRDRIPFTAKLIKHMTRVLKDWPSIFGVVLGMLAVMVVWLLVWLLAVVAAVMPGHGKGGLGILFVLFLSFYWGCQVLANVCHVTTAGLAGRWYFQTQLQAPVGTAFQHAWTYQFGSICFGSFLVALVQAVEAVVRMVQDQARDDDNVVAQIAACVALCCLNCLESVFRLFNTFAFTIVAIYSVPFCRAGAEVIALMEESGLEGIMNYQMVGIVTFIGKLAAAILNAICLAVLAWRMHLETPWVLGAAVLGFLVAFAVASVVAQLLESGTTSLFTCWAMEPKALEKLSDDLNTLIGEVKTVS